MKDKLSQSQQFDRILREKLLFLALHDPVPPDVPLFELGLDSIGAVALLTELEDAFGIAFDDELLDIELFSGAAHLWERVEHLSACSTADH